MLTYLCMARCTHRAGTMKQAKPMRRPWKRARSKYWRAWASKTRIDAQPDTQQAHHYNPSRQLCHLWHHSHFWHPSHPSHICHLRHLCRASPAGATSAIYQGVALIVAAAFFMMLLDGAILNTSLPLMAKAWGLRRWH